MLDTDGKLTIETQNGIIKWADFNSMGTNAYVNDIKTVEIKSGVGSIHNYSFAGCSQLTGVTIPDSVTDIRSSAFWLCTSLTSIEIPDSVTVIGESVFEDCSSLESITGLGGVTKINKRAFANCTGLKEITLPAGLTQIGEIAFRECTNLESVIMQGDTPPTLSDPTDVFQRCYFVSNKVKGIKVPEGTAKVYKEAWTKWTDYITDGTDGTEDEFLASGEGWTLDKDGKLTIASDTGMENWEGDENHSDNKKKIKTVELLDGVTFIKWNALAESSLTDITIPSSVTKIEDHAFTGSGSLTNITIPESVTTIGASAFRFCRSLESVTMLGEIPAAIDGNVFGSCKFETDGTKGIKVPAGTAAVYKAAWTEWTDYITDGTDGTEDEPENWGEGWTLYKSGKLTIESAAGMMDWEHQRLDYSEKVISAEIEMNNDAPITSIGAYAFSNCANLTSVTIADSVESIGQRAFEDCGSLTGIKLSNSLKSIEENTFQDCSKLTDITIPDSVTSIGGWAFWKCKALENITIPDSVTNIGDYVFYECDSLSEVTLPSGMASIQDGMFNGCSKALKKAIDKALAETEVTNDNAQEVAEQIGALIPDAVAGALEAAGVSPDEIEIGEVDIRIEPAADRDGSIKVTIPVTSREEAGVSGNASVQVPVTKPGGEEEPDKEAEAAKKAVEEALKNITITNETTLEDILDALKEALGEDVTVEGIEELERVEATQDAPGRLRLKITLKVNGKTIYVTVDAAIAQPERKTGVYVPSRTIMIWTAPRLFTSIPGWQSSPRWKSITMKRS